MMTTTVKYIFVSSSNLFRLMFPTKHVNLQFFVYITLGGI